MKLRPGPMECYGWFSGMDLLAGVSLTVVFAATLFKRGLQAG